MNASLEELEQTLAAGLSDLNAQQTQLSPTTQPHKWSIQQITEHLLLTYTLTCNSVQTRLYKGSPTQAVPSLAQRIAQIYVITLGFFPEGRSAPTAVDPQLYPEPLSGHQLSASVHQQIFMLDRILNQAEKLFAETRSVSHHALGPMNSHQWRRFHLIHSRHHAKQIVAIRQQHGL